MSLDLFADRVIAELSSKSSHENILFSPLSVSMALTVILCGSQGETKEQIMKAFGLDTDSSKDEELIEKFQKLTSKYPAAEVTTLNNLFPESRYVIKSDYLNLMKSLDCSVRNLPYLTEEDRAKSAGVINKLVAEHTNNKIQNLIAPELLDELTRFVLTSVVYFKGEWSNKFEKTDTELGTFYNSDGTETAVAMMSQMKRGLRTGYDKSLDVSCLEMPYLGKEYSMWIFLPNKRFGLSKELTVQKMKTMMQQSEFKGNHIALDLPKFKLCYESPLRKKLENLGMKNMFLTDQADLTKISDEPGLHVSDIVHKAFIEVNEEGTEAAAVTSKKLSYVL